MLTPALRHAQDRADGQPRPLDAYIIPEKKEDYVYIMAHALSVPARDRHLADRIVQALLPLIEERLDHKFAAFEQRIKDRLVALTTTRAASSLNSLTPFHSFLCE